MLILLTNDDGIRAPGLAAMHHELTALGEVHVVAPETVQSATSHGITLHTPLLTQPIDLGAFSGIAVDGSPADCVKLAVTQLLPRPPALVVSGMNLGANVGINVLYSGTVAAALEAAFLGLPAVAVSLYLNDAVPTDPPRAARWALQVIRQCLAAGLGAAQAVSINLPALGPQQAPAGVKLVRQCTRAWVDTYQRRRDPRGRDYFWNASVFTLGNTEPDTDVAALREGYITVTPLQFDLTQHTLLRDWANRSWSI